MFYNKLRSEPHKMEDDLHVLHPKGFSQWFIIKQNWNFTRNKQHGTDKGTDDGTDYGTDDEELLLTNGISASN